MAKLRERAPKGGHGEPLGAPSILRSFFFPPWSRQRMCSRGLLSPSLQQS